MATHEYKTKSGYTLRLRRIPIQVVELAMEQVAKGLRVEGVPLDPPGFSLRTDLPGGQQSDAQWFPHTPSTLIDPDDPHKTAENQARWQAYQNALQRLETARNTKRITLWYQYGVTIQGGIPGIPEPDDADAKIAAYQAGSDDGEWMDAPAYWQTVSRMIGATLPKEPLELKARWLIERCLSSEEIAEVSAELFGLQMEGSLKPEELESFREGIRAQAAGAIRSRITAIVNSVGRTVSTPEGDGTGSSG